MDINRWILYRPGSVLDKDTAFVPSDADCRLSPRSLLAVDPEPSDPEVDIVIYEKPERKYIMTEFAVTGNYHQTSSKVPFIVVKIHIHRMTLPTTDIGHSSDFA